MKRVFPVVVLLVALLLSGCQMRTVDQMYAVPRRSAEYEELQKAKRVAEYYAMLDKSFEELKRGDVVVKSLEELRGMENE